MGSEVSRGDHKTRMYKMNHFWTFLFFVVYLTRLTRNKANLPSEVDLDGARLAFLRLQNVFVLPTKVIVEGIDQHHPVMQLGKLNFVTKSVVLISQTPKTNFTVV